jgi:hypothetical protein
MPTITSEIIIAYSQCPRKAYLLLFEKEEEIAVEYIEFLKKRKQNHQEAYLKSINTTASEITLSRIQELEYQEKSYFSKVTLQFNEFQARCDLLCIEQIEEDLDNLRYEPRILTRTYSVTKEQKLNLLFIGYLLEKILKLSINKGKIISLDNSCHTIKLNDNAKLIKPLINPINKWIKTFPSEPPPVILNKHCPYCQFQVSCREKADTHENIDFVNQPKKIHTERGELVHRQFEIILETAHRDYDRNKISLRLLDNQKTFSRRKKTKSTNASRPSKQFSLKSRQPDLSVEVNPLEFCPIHCNELKISKYLSFKTIIDLIFSNNGVTKKVIRYFGNKSYCFQCKRYYSPPDISKYTTLQMYDRGFKIWIVYHRVSLKLPNRTIARAIKEQFGESITSHTIRRFIKSTADDYVETETALIKNMLRSSAIYVDETPINIQGENWYVWVFTDGIRVVFKLTETRESAIVKETLSNFQGVLVSDFYPGYNSLEYQQQKCWVHLIRDINNDLWKFPFDREYEELVLAVRDLIIPIFKTIESYGLKSNKLIKYKSNVEEFYQRVIVDHYYQSELSIKYQKRFLRYRNSLFTFLEKDKVKWHNNMAENAIRHLAKQREISVTFSKSLTPSYLRLLGIMQTCRYQNKSFLKFLQSEKKDIDKFKIFI